MTIVDRYGKRFLLAAGLLTLATIAFWMLRVFLTGSSRYSFITWNLMLAWASLIPAVFLVKNLRHMRWLSWQNISLTALWVLFLPNAWYVLTDFIHISPNGAISQLYDIILIILLVFTCFIIGFASLFLIHRELLRRFSEAKSYAYIECIILIASFAVYLGRDLRWNSWDVIANPTVLINVSDSVIDPFGNPRAVNVTLLFFSLISLLYLALYIFTYPAKPRR